MGRAAVRARSAFRIGMARPRLVSLCLALALLALGDARVIRKEPDEQRLIGWLGEVPREASGGALGRKHGPRDAEYLANDANDSSDVVMRDVDEPTTVTLGHSSSSSNIEASRSSSSSTSKPQARARTRHGSLKVRTRTRQAQARARHRGLRLELELDIES